MTVFPPYGAIVAVMAAQRAQDAKPCPSCDGDRLRPDYTGSGRCHAERSSS